MRDNGDDNLALMLALVVVGISFLLATFLVPWPKSLADWQGDKAPVEVFANVVGPLGALAAFAALFASGRATNRTFRQTKTAQIVSTFQKGAEMLAGQSEAMAMSGIAVLNQVAREDSTLLTPVTTCLEGYVYEVDQINWKRADKSFAGDIDGVTDSKSSALRAIETVSLLHYPIEGVDPFVINKAYLARWTLPNMAFGALQLRNAKMHHMTFVDCTFPRTIVSAFIGDNVRFIRGNFTNATFYLRDMKGRVLTPGDGHAIWWEDVKNYEGFTINSIPFEVWQNETAPRVQRDDRGMRIA